MMQEVPMPDRLSQLIAWVAQGWQVEAPVLQRDVLRGRDGRMAVFEVVMRRGSERRVLALNSDQAVDRWLQEAKVAVLNI